MPEATVLVVEDEESFVEALTIGLVREGFRVQVARDGAEALDMFDAVRPDLVLLDVMLPKVSGIDVCRELRKKSTVPIIMVTAKGIRDRHGRRARGRRRRLRHQAVPGARAGGPDAGGAASDRAPRATTSTQDAMVVGDVTLDPERHEVRIRGEVTAAPAQGVRAAPRPARQRRPGADPRPAHRPGLGRGLRRRHQDPRRPREAPPGQGRDRPVDTRRGSSRSVASATSSSACSRHLTPGPARIPLGAHGRSYDRVVRCEAMTDSGGWRRSRAPELGAEAFDGHAVRPSGPGPRRRGRRRHARHDRAGRHAVLLDRSRRGARARSSSTWR